MVMFNRESEWVIKCIDIGESPISFMNSTFGNPFALTKSMSQS